MIKRREDHKGLNITFNVTEDCNLRCSYCYETGKRPGDLPFEYAKKFIDLILIDPDPIGARDTKEEWILNQGLTLDFIGGDALMKPQLVREILRYFIFSSVMRHHRWATRWRASISTNGTLFDEPGVKDFLIEFAQNLSLGTSVDGCPEIHNKNRSNSMDKILKNWDWYLDYAGELASTKSTLSREGIPYLYESLKFMHEDLKLRYINQNFIFEPLGETEEDLEEFDRQLEKCVDYTFQHRNDLYWSMIDEGVARSTRMSDPDSGWCGSGSMPCLGINGKIYPCFRFMPHTMSSREIDFHVGDVWNGFDHKDRFQIVRDQTRKKISESKCFECSVESSCAWCLGGAYSENGCFYRQTNICKVQKIRAKWAKIYWTELDKLKDSHIDKKELVYAN